MHVSWLRPVVRRHPVAAFLWLVYATITVLAFVPVLTQPGLLPGGATLHAYTENILGVAVPAFVVTAIIGGRDGVGGCNRLDATVSCCPRTGWSTGTILAGRDERPAVRIRSAPT